MHAPVTINAALTVNAIITRYPATVAVFNAHGIDACCGGAVPLRDAARANGETLVLLATIAPRPGAHS